MKILILGIYILYSALAYAMQPGTDLSGSINPEISEVSTGGFWKENDNYGNWRVIVRKLGWEHTRSLLYLQWLRVDDKANKIIVHKTIPIPKINTENWHHIQNVEYNNSSFTIYYTIRGQNTAHKLTLFPGFPGKYTID
jgi:hypothetical protein